MKRDRKGTALVWAIVHTGGGILELGPNVGAFFSLDDDLPLEAFAELWGEHQAQDHGEPFRSVSTPATERNGPARIVHVDADPLDHEWITGTTLRAINPADTRDGYYRR